MKNYPLKPGVLRYFGLPPKILLIMKMLIIILTTCLMQVSAASFAQKLTLSKKGATLEQIFAEIRKQTGYFVVYAENKVDKNTRMDVNFNNSDLKDVLDVVSKSQDLVYTFDEKNISLKPKAPTFLERLAERWAAIDITGRVVDEDGNPLAGATVKVKDGKGATMTDAQGRFLIEKVNEGATIVFSYTGYVSKEVTAKQNMGSITLKLSDNPLDQVQIIAYGTTSKRLSTSNVATVTAKEIEQQPVNNPLLALQGRVPGLLVTQNTGLANGAFTVRIQGQNSIGYGSDPLIVVDGVPLAYELFGVGGAGGSSSAGGPLGGGIGLSGNNPINFINPSDIESIVVLKDADATSIYGSRAANGAILITTKKGSPGKIKINLSARQGWGKVGKEVDMLNTRQYLDMRYEAIRNDGLSISDGPNYDLRLWDTTRYTNWQKELIGGTAQYSNINASISGGSNAVQFLVGGTFDRSTTVFPGDFASKTGNIHFNINTNSLNQRFKLSLTGSYAVNSNGVPGQDLTRYALFLAPNAPSLYNDDGSLNWAPNAAGRSTFVNPLAGAAFSAYEYFLKSLTSNAIISYSILPGLVVKSSFGYNNINGNPFFSISANARPPEERSNTSRSSVFSNVDSFSLIAEPQLTFNKVIGNISIDAIVGSTFQKNKGEYNIITAYGFSNDLLIKNLASASSIQGSYDNTIYRYNALFGRMNVVFDQKFVFNLTGRRDGSSRFGENNLFHNFWSLGGAWIFSEEESVEKALSFLSFGKIRGSYGTTGNDQIGDYQYLNAYFTPTSRLPYQNIQGLSTNELKNPYLQWEETRKLMAGIDLGFFKDRLLLDFTYSRNRSSNQLLFYTLPSITGVSGLIQNFPATVQNTSWEFSLSTIPIKIRQFSWNCNLNLTIPRNKVIKFPDIENTSYANPESGVIVGQPLGALPYYQYLGIDPARGNYLLANENQQPVFGFGPQISGRNQIISTQPMFYGGILNTLSYKGFSLDFLFQFIRQKGSKSLYFWNDYAQTGEFTGMFSNQPISVLNRWQKPGDASRIQKYTTASGVPAVSQTNAYFSYDASFVRLKNLSLSWQIPESWLRPARLQNASLYLRGQNLATISRYSGLDPETQSSSALPPLQMWAIGFTVGL
ncbi:TonB-linked SusC/RagA family outer membrane protein [Pedobacter sp. AK017]|uniref:SusC/RagA family TonB-linked outer membrane protein n=1 Tax=Pedobacter sp. AK017 TaxID=2723073 RepID=UPI001607EC0D|nr:SusC/RagA family TonB-linked outer membrane protein [Pedobacter sp. AK017]MBB5437285.1 TonB-linked SusC/RagA family outer membrane protein [Pedobacter sp. AK017]